MPPDFPSWVAQYTDLPFADKGRDRSGVDCLGLVRLVEEDQFNAEIPSYADRYQTIADKEEIDRLVEGVLPLLEKIELGTERPGDIVLLRIRGYRWHVGIVIKRGWMLHIQVGIESVIEHYMGPYWRPRVAGIHRPGEVR